MYIDLSLSLSLSGLTLERQRREPIQENKSVIQSMYICVCMVRVELSGPPVDYVPRIAVIVHLRKHNEIHAYRRFIYKGDTNKHAQGTDLEGGWSSE